MKVITVFENPYRRIRLFLFISPNGRLITSFFQVLAPTDTILGCFDSYDEAAELLSEVNFDSYTLIEKPASFFTGLLSNNAF